MASRQSRAVRGMDHRFRIRWNQDQGIMAGFLSPCLLWRARVRGNLPNLPIFLCERFSTPEEGAQKTPEEIPDSQFWEGKLGPFGMDCHCDMPFSAVSRWKVAGDAVNGGGPRGRTGAFASSVIIDPSWSRPNGSGKRMRRKIADARPGVLLRLFS